MSKNTKTKAQKSLGPDVPPTLIPGLPFSAQQLEDLRKNAFKVHLENVFLGPIADPQPPIAKTQMGASCPVCKQLIAAFIGYNIAMTARFEHAGCDVKFTCSGTDDQPHDPAEVSMRMFHDAQKDAMRLMTAAPAST